MEEDVVVVVVVVVGAAVVSWIVEEFRSFITLLQDLSCPIYYIIGLVKPDLDVYPRGFVGKERALGRGCPYLIFYLGVSHIKVIHI